MKALITGITGQDGSYLAEWLLLNGWEVHGLVRRSSIIKTDRIDHIFDRITLHYGDMTDATNLMAVMNTVKPDVVYNLAAQSHVAVSFETPAYTAQSDAIGTLNMLEIIRQFFPETKFYQASTSELFGDKPPPQNEDGPFQPRSPYAAAKLYAYWLVRNYREAYNLFAVNGILFNHESPRRGETFVTRKITRYFGKMHRKMFLEEPLRLGNMGAIRDWSHAKDMVRGMKMMMDHHTPTDFVMGSGEGYTVKEFVDKCLDVLDIKSYTKTIEGFNRGYDERTHRNLWRVDPKYFRPLEVNALVSDPQKARRELNWKPKYDLEGLVQEMMLSDMGKYDDTERWEDKW